MKFKNFFIKSLVLLAICSLFAYGYLQSADNKSITVAVIIGMTIGYINTLLGFAILSWGYQKNSKDFMLSVFGSMIFRFLLIFAILFILIAASKVEKVPLIASLVVVYFSFLGLEVIEIYRSTKLRGFNEVHK